MIHRSLGLLAADAYVWARKNERKRIGGFKRRVVYGIEDKTRTEQRPFHTLEGFVRGKESYWISGKI